MKHHTLVAAVEPMIVENVAHFASVLRTVGMTLWADRVRAAIAAVEAMGVDLSGDTHAALATVMLDRHEQQALFDAAREPARRGARRTAEGFAAATGRCRTRRRTALRHHVQLLGV